MLGRHFHSDIQRGIITQGLSTIDEVELYLRKVDETNNVSLNSEANRSSNFPRRKPAHRENNTAQEGGWRERGNNDNTNNSGSNTNRNTNIHNITLFNRDFEEILSDPESDSEETAVITLPTLSVCINETRVEMLVDSGSPINAISEKMLKQLNQSSNYPVLPVNKLAIGGSIGSSKQRISRQVMLPISMGGSTFDIIFFVVPGLAKDTLLGYSWFKLHGGTISTETGIFSFLYEGVAYEVPVEDETIDTMRINFCDISNVGVSKA